jgi:hypothetical protein
MGERIRIVEAARSRYDAYDSKEWDKAYFDEFSGGFNVYHRKHQFREKSVGSEAEKTVGKMLAKLGKQVEFLPEGGKKSPDLGFDDKKWEIKYINNANETTMREYVKDARKAGNVIFYWDKNDKYAELNMAVIREAGRMAKNNQINEMPDIYILENGDLKLLWSKK